jgi:tetratricopeptide (TPR) repeat protein
MPRKEIILALLVLMLVALLSSGCTENTPETNPELTRVAPKAVDLHKQGFDAYSNGNYETALDLYNQAIAADSNYTRAWMEKGNALLRLNRYEEAISVYDVVLAREDYVPEVWNSRGEALMATGNYTAARESFDKAIRIAPDYTKAKENRDLALKKIQEGETKGQA